MDKCCRTCAYQIRLECRAEPPKIISSVYDDDDDAIDVFDPRIQPGVWPSILPYHWCARWTEKSTK